MNAEEAAFLAAISANAADDLPKLVFADWLDERSDPAGEGMRVAVKQQWRPVLSGDSRTTVVFAWRRLRLYHAGRFIGEVPRWLYRGIARAAPGSKGRPITRIEKTNEAWFHDLPSAWDAYLIGWREAVKAGRWPRPKREKIGPMILNTWQPNLDAPSFLSRTMDFVRDLVGA